MKQKLHGYDIAFDFQDPDYTQVIQIRNARAQEIAKDPAMLQNLKNFYRDNPWEFVNDWGWTFEPRNIEIGRPAKIPFVLFQRQVEFMRWIWDRWHARERGLCEKSRDCGVTWLVVGFFAAQFLFQPGFTAGFGSRKEEYLDKKGDEKAFFNRMRFFLSEIPDMFKPQMYHSSHMVITNPKCGTGVVGELGASIGRGGRTSIYVVDEAAHLLDQDSVDKALSQNTNCQLDVSSVNGTGNAFHHKKMRYKDTDQVFIFDWKEDPRKDRAWYEHQCANFDEETIAQEIDRDYNASQVDAFLPAKWIAACVDAHLELGFEATGIRGTGFDPSDVGDPKAYVHRRGSVIIQAEQTRDGDITVAIPWAANAADDNRSEYLSYDADGMGAPAMKLSFQRRVSTRMQLVPYYGSSGVVDPEMPARLFRKKRQEFRQGKIKNATLVGGQEKTNADTYLNYRAQTWGWFRQRAYNTYVAITAKRNGRLINADPGDLISISSACRHLIELQSELSRPKRIRRGDGKFKVESKEQMRERGVDSPNLADAAIIATAIDEVEFIAAVRPQAQAKKRKGRRLVDQRVHDSGVGY